jgi:tetratricopeptide (TPR) repeat protein
MKGDLDAAQAEFEAAVRLAPQHALAHRALGLVLRQKGDLEAARVELTRAVDLAPEDAEGHYNLGSVLLKLNDLPGAVEQLRQAVGLDAYLSEARQQLIQALQRSGKSAEAAVQRAEANRVDREREAGGQAMVLIDAAKQSLANNEPQGGVAKLRQAVALALKASGKDLAEVESQLRRALALRPGDAQAHYELGQALEAAGKNDEALAQYRAAVDNAPSLVAAHRALARDALAAKDRLTAAAEFRSVLAWQPNDAEAQEALGHLGAEHKP